MKIVLIGFMGAGKTTIGKLFAKNQNHKYIDMDQLIISKSGRKSDTDIFDTDGEKKFRELETEVAKDLENATDCIISTGGGVVMNQINMDYLKNKGIAVYLKNSFKTSQNRISKKNPPPLFRDLDRAENLYNLRIPLYKKYADLIVETEDKTLDEIKNELVYRLNQL